MGWRCCKCYRGVAHGPYPWCACGHFRCRVCQHRPFNAVEHDSDLENTKSNDEMRQDGEKKQDEIAAELPKQTVSTWDNEMAMAGPHAKQGKEEGGNEQDKGSAKSDKQEN